MQKHLNTIIHPTANMDRKSEVKIEMRRGCIDGKVNYWERHEVGG